MGVSTMTHARLRETMISVGGRESSASTPRRDLELEPSQLHRRLDPNRLPFRTTEEVEPLVGTIGQPRALAAIEFGLEVETPGYNLFVAGVPGSGRLSTARDYLERLAQAKPSPDD